MNNPGGRNKIPMTVANRTEAEDFEDFRIVSERLAKPFKTISNDDVWEALGLSDKAGKNRCSR